MTQRAVRTQAAVLVDAHCHIDTPELARQLPAVLELMRRNGVGLALCAGVSVEGLPSILALARAHREILAAVGVHPEHTEGHDPTLAELIALAQAPEIIAIGETGLDYYWHKDQPEWQRERFRTHIRAARACGKPLVVHNRDATADVLRLLHEEGAAAVGGMMHCFTESWAVAETVLALGFHVSLSGIVTFKNALQVQEVARRVPLDRLLLETDSPYLAPVPYRGKLNQPGYVRHVAEAVAALRGMPVDTLIRATTDNFLRLFPYSRTRVES